MEKSRVIEGLESVDRIPQMLSDVRVRLELIRVLSKVTKQPLSPNQVVKFLKSLRNKEGWTKALAIPEASIDMAIALVENILDEIKEKKHKVAQAEERGNMMLLAVKALQTRLRNSLEKLIELDDRRQQIQALLKYGHLSEQQANSAGKGIAVLNAKIAQLEGICEQLRVLAVASAVKLTALGLDYKNAEFELACTVRRLYDCAACAISGITPEVIKSKSGKNVFYAGEGSVAWEEGAYMCWQSPLVQSGSEVHKRVSEEMFNFLKACGMSSRVAAHVCAHENLHSSPDLSGWAAFRAKVNLSNPEGDFIGWYQPFGKRRIDTVADILDAVRDPSEDDDNFKALIDDAVRKHGDNVIGVFTWGKKDWVDVWRTNPVAFEHYQRVRAEMEEC